MTYDFNWTDIAQALVTAQSVEDGYWRIVTGFEPLYGNFPRTYEDQREETMPGCLLRVAFLRLERAEGPGLMVFKVERGLIDATDTNQRGPEEGGGSSRRNKRPSKNRHPASASVEY